MNLSGGINLHIIQVLEELWLILLLQAATLS